MTSRAQSSVSSYQRAFEETRDARAALAVEELIAVDLDVLETVSVVLGRLPRVHALRAEITQHFRSSTALVALDALESYALALGHAQVRYMAAPRDDHARLIVAVEDRQRAFTLLALAYDAIRHVAMYLRFTGEDDGEWYLPSLWKGEVGSFAAHVRNSPQLS